LFLADDREHHVHVAADQGPQIPAMGVADCPRDRAPCAH
jgi:hypothetical protein